MVIPQKHNIIIQVNPAELTTIVFLTRHSKDGLQFEDGYTNDKSLNAYVDGLDKDYVLTSSERDSYGKLFTSILIPHSDIVQNECIGEGGSLSENLHLLA